MKNHILAAILTIVFGSAHAASTRTIEATNTEGHLSMQNLVSNAGAEVNTKGWTASGGSFARSTTTPDRGDGVFTWDSSGAAQTLMSASVAIPPGMYGRNGVVSCPIKCASGTCTHQLMTYDGTTEVGATTITSSTTIYAPTTVNIGPIPSSGNLRVRLKSVAADEPSIAIGECFLGQADGYNIASVVQPVFIASGYIAGTSGCTPTRSSATPGAFGTDAQCPGPTVELNPGPGTLQTTDADLIKFTVNSLPAGVYRVTMGGITCTKMTSGAAFVMISDGTTNSGTGTCDSQDNGGSGTSVEGWFSYTGQANRSFELYGANTTGNAINVYAGNTSERLTFSITRFPSSAETIYRADQTANSWSGYHDNTCSWARTNTAYGDPTADASCALVERVNKNFGAVSTSGSVLPAITFTPSKIGTYHVCAKPKVENSASGAGVDVRLWDGTTTITESRMVPAANGDVHTMSVCGLYTASSTAAKTLSLQTKATSGSVTIATGSANASALEWEIYPVDGSFPMPNIVNSISSNTSGSERLERATVACVTGTGSITSQSGTWLSGYSYSSTGVCTATMAGFSAAPTCVQADSNDLGARYCSVKATSATALTIHHVTNTGASDGTCSIICMGPR